MNVQQPVVPEKKDDEYAELIALLKEEKEFVYHEDVVEVLIEVSPRR